MQYVEALNPHTPIPPNMSVFGDFNEEIKLNEASRVGPNQICLISV
jgi:hypothetical protein